MPPHESAPARESPFRVLVVEDDPAMAIALRDGFAYEGCTVLMASDGAAGLRLAEEGGIDVIILDLMLPKLSGLDVCARLRQASNDVPIIMVTARSQEADKLQGLSVGADDYVTKPFSFLELLARTRAVLRRSRKPPPLDTFVCGDMTFDFRRLRATRNGAALDLSPREFAILGCLIAAQGEVVTREQLLHQVWGYRRPPFTRTVDMHIAKLRRKIEPGAGAPELIVTIHGVGYKFVC